MRGGTGPIFGRVAGLTLAVSLVAACDTVRARREAPDAAVARPAEQPALAGAVRLDEVSAARLGGEGRRAAWGLSVACAGDLNADGVGDVVLGAPHDATGGEGAGAAGIVHGPVTAVPGGASRLTPDALRIGRAPGDGTGVSVAPAGDVDGDGFDDVLIGAWQADGAARDTGAAYLLRGPLSAGSVQLGEADAVLLGDQPDGYAGFAVAGVGDLDGDGLDDVLVSSFHERERGAVGVLYGPVTRGAVLLDDADARIFGEAEGDHLGISLAGAGDVDGDGLADVLLGAPFHDATGVLADAGAAYVVLGPVRDGEGDDLSDAYARLLGEGPGDQAGTSVARAGDVTGDGIDDLLVGAPFADRAGLDAGAVYVVGGPVPRGVTSLGDAYAVLVGESAGDLAGIAVAGVPDLDGDGLAEVLVGAWGSDVGGDTSGAAYLVYGRDAHGVVSLASPGVAVRLSGPAELDSTGGSVAACDVDGDGRGDLLIGAAGTDGTDRDQGAVFVVTSAGRPAR